MSLEADRLEAAIDKLGLFLHLPTHSGALTLQAALQAVLAQSHSVAIGSAERKALAGLLQLLQEALNAGAEEQVN